MPKTRIDPIDRPSWDEWGLGLAFAASRRADCTRRQVGAVAMGADHRVLGCSYNGAPAGVPGCATTRACPRGRVGYDELPAAADYLSGPGRCIALHAEENAILHLSAEQRRGATLYVSDTPCPNCTRLLRGSGFVRVVFPSGELRFE